MSINGILNVFKPSGKTSFDVVSFVRRLSGERRVGHAGTLDPAATGVLPVCLGQGTRVIEFMSGAPKTYSAQIELGIVTDTYDATGKVIQECNPSFVTKEDVENALESFCGPIQQIPPMYSAIKHHGKRLYQLARLGIDIPRKPREVHIFRAQLLAWCPPVFTVEVECSSGTYIRSLAHDIGLTLGCGACLKTLIRLVCGPFDVSQAITLTGLEEAFHNGYWESFLYPIDEVLLNWDAIVVDEIHEEAIIHGRSIPLEELSCHSSDSQSDHCRVYSTKGDLLAVLCWREDENLWHPDKVFSSAANLAEGLQD